MSSQGWPPRVLAYGSVLGAAAGVWVSGVLVGSAARGRLAGPLRECELGGLSLLLALLVRQEVVCFLGKVDVYWRVLNWCCRDVLNGGVGVWCPVDWWRRGYSARRWLHRAPMGALVAGSAYEVLGSGHRKCWYSVLVEVWVHDRVVIACLVESVD